MIQDRQILTKVAAAESAPPCQPPTIIVLDTTNRVQDIAILTDVAANRAMAGGLLVSNGVSKVSYVAWPKSRMTVEFRSPPTKRYGNFR